MVRQARRRPDRKQALPDRSPRGSRGLTGNPSGRPRAWRSKVLRYWGNKLTRATDVIPSITLRLEHVMKIDNMKHQFLLEKLIQSKYTILSGLWSKLNDTTPTRNAEIEALQTELFALNIFMSDNNIALASDDNHNLPLKPRSDSKQPKFDMNRHCKALLNLLEGALT